MSEAESRSTGASNKRQYELYMERYLEWTLAHARPHHDDSVEENLVDYVDQLMLEGKQFSEN